MSARLRAERRGTGELPVPMIDLSREEFVTLFRRE
jgi:hypothetical protein